MKKILVISTSGMYIGGIERSLIGLLNTFDYDKYDVDLYLFSHKGEFYNFITSNVHVFPLEKNCDLIREPIVTEIKNGCIYLAAIRLYSKTLCAIKKKIGLQGNYMMEMSFRMLNYKLPQLKKEYDLALGFFGPHDFLVEKVNAKVKIGWIHTDYSQVEYNINYTSKIWKKLDYIAAVSDECGRVFGKLLPEVEEKIVTIENILDSKFVKQQAELEVPIEMQNWDGYIKLCSVGRFCEAKAFDEAVKACRILVEKGYKIKWFLIGYGPDEEKIKSEIVKNHMEESFFILGKKKIHIHI